MNSPWWMRFGQGLLIGLGAVLPGISGGVLCVVFGIYQPVMELLANPRLLFSRPALWNPLLPVFFGGVCGFLGVARVLSVLLDKYPAPSVCLFAGLILGMIPGLLRDAGSRGSHPRDWTCLWAAFIVTILLLTGLQLARITIVPNWFWYFFCGICAALSIIAPGLSFSTLLMPLGLYVPFLAGLSSFQAGTILPSVLGALLTVILLSRVVNHLFETKYSPAMHAMTGLVLAATLVIIPFGQMSLIALLFLAGGILAGYEMDRYNARYAV